MSLGMNIACSFYSAVGLSFTEKIRMSLGMKLSVTVGQHSGEKKMARPNRTAILDSC